MASRVANFHPVADLLERLPLPPFRPLPIIDVQRRRVLRAEIPHRQRRTHGRIHAAAEHYQNARFWGRWPSRFVVALVVMRLARSAELRVYTPFIDGSQMNL